MEVIDSIALIEYMCKQPKLKTILNEYKYYYPDMKIGETKSWFILYTSLVIYIADYYKLYSKIIVCNKDVKVFIHQNMDGYYDEMMYLQKLGTYSDEELFNKAYGVLAWMFDPSDYEKTYKMAAKYAKIY